MIQETSLLAYNNIKPKLKGMRLKIFNTLKEIEPANNLMISNHSGLVLSNVCGRMNELRNKFKKVTFVKKEKCPYTNKITQFWRTIK